MHTTALNPWTWPDHYGSSQAVVVAGNPATVYVAGQGSVDADGRPVHEGDLTGQVGQALDNLAAVLAEAGLDLSHVVRYDVYTTDVAGYLAVSGLVADRFAEFGTVPVVGVLAEVSRLAVPQLLVELVAIAAG